MINLTAAAVHSGDLRKCSIICINKWDGLAFGAFPGCVTRCFTHESRFLPPRSTKVTIYATQCHHFLWNLGICEATNDSSHASSKKREKKPIVVGCIWGSLQTGTSFVRHCDIIGLQMRPLKDADHELRHSKCRASSGEW